MFHIIKRFMPTGLQELVRPAYHRYLLRRNKKLVEKFGEQEMIRRCYFDVFGKNPDFDNPQTFTEKLAWLKLNDHNPLMTKCADKIEVRNYVKDTIGESYLTPTYGIYYNPEEIDFDALPDECIIKASHGSHCNIFFDKKKNPDRKKIINQLKHWISLNYYYFGFERSYKNIQPGIIIEKVLKDEMGNIPNDIKFFCFNGEPKLISYVENRFSAKQQRSFFTNEWDFLPIKYLGYPMPEKPCAYPLMLPQILNLSRTLSVPFIFTRADFYLVNNKIYFGELTFYPDGAHCIFEPKCTDNEFGKLLKLPL